MTINKDKAEQAVVDFLAAFDLDINIEGLSGTPARVVAMFEEILTQEDINFTTFEKDHKEMVLMTDITFTSMCEHHLMPFTGTVDIAYIPQGRILGLSKLARVVDKHAHALQTQETMGTDILNELSQHVGNNVILRIRAEHFCMVARGVKKFGAQTITVDGRGVFEASLKSEERREFLEAVVK